MTQAKPRQFKPGEIVTYHGRRITVLDVGSSGAPSGGSVTWVRVDDPRRGRRTMFGWQLEEGLGAKPEKLLTEATEGEFR